MPTRSMRRQKSSYFGEHRKRMTNGERCAKFKSTAHAESNIRAERGCKRKSRYLGNPFPPYVPLLWGPGRGPQISMTLRSGHLH